MENHSNTYDWKENLENILLKLNRKIYIFLLIYFCLLSFGLSVRRFFYTNESLLYIFGMLGSQILFLAFIYIISQNLTTRKKSDIFFYFFVISLDIIYLVLCIIYKDDDPLYTRFMYHFLGYGVMLMNIRSDHTWKLFILTLTIKFLILVSILSLYNFSENLGKNLVIDFFMILLSFGMIITNKLVKSVLFESLEEDNKKIIALTARFKNLLNSLRDPIISINLTQDFIFLNSSFINLIKAHFEENEYVLNTLFDENHSFRVGNEEYLNNLCKKMNLNPFYLDNPTLKEISKVFDRDVCNISIIKFFIIHKVFINFKKESRFPNEIHNGLDFLELIKNPKIFLENEKFEIRGDYKFTVSQHEKIFEVSWRKSIFNQKELMIDIILNDITSVRDSQFLKADIKYRKIYLAKIAHEFKTPLNSLIYSVKQLIPKFNLDDQVENDIKFIEGQANFLSILIHDINDYCKEIDDFDINLDDIIIREILIFAFNILECLISQDNYKKDNVKLNLIIDDNLPKMIRTDEKRLKQLLVNLISNSVKFTNFGHISIIAQYNDLNEIMITVEDTGIGIKNEEQSKLFSEYSDINKEYFKLNKNGTGLGLSICKKIIQKLGGILKCESDSHLTKFYFTLNHSINNDEILTCNENLPISIFSNDVDDKTVLYRNLTKKIDIMEKSNTIKNNNELSNRVCNLEKSINLELFSAKSSKRYSSRHISTKSNKISIYSKKIEERLLNMFSNEKFAKYKSNFFNFNESLIKYMHHMIHGKEDQIFILIVDDELMNIKSLSNNIKLFMKTRDIKNIKLLKIKDGIEALNLLYYDIIFFMKIRLVISDLNMKFMNGDYLHRNMQYINNNALKNIKFVLYTNTEREALLEMDLGINHFLKKPCEKRDVEGLFNYINL